MTDGLLDLPFDDVGLHEGSESSHDAWLEMDATSPESSIIGSQHAYALFQTDTLSPSKQP